MAELSGVDQNGGKTEGQLFGRLLAWFRQAIMSGTGMVATERRADVIEIDVQAPDKYVRM